MVVSKSSWPKAPFSSTVETHPLLIIDYQLIKKGDKEEAKRLYEACTSIGFFYLAGHGIDPEPMFEMGEETFDLPEEELLKFEQGDGGMSAGYKKAGSTNVDKLGNVDTVQFINVAKDDAVHYPTVRQRTYPSSCNKRMPTIQGFINTSDEILLDLMGALEPLLDIPSGTLAKLHTKTDLSGSESRVITKPAPGERAFLAEGKDEGGNPAAAIGAHTDFGSFSMLFHRGTGGLQVLTPGSEEWQYIKPMEGLAVCNVGDTLAVYSGGILRSNIHRVVPPPPPQNQFARYSLVYFIRPSFDAELFPLSDVSAKVGAAAKTHPTIGTMERGVTNAEWFQRRIKFQRASNRTGPESWEKSRGTEHTPGAA
ncbi:Clavaminate synthase-like protein [Meredithblackwellia eburnea MCA 4105]